MSVKTGTPRTLWKTRMFAAVCAGTVTLFASLPANAAFVITGGSSQPFPISGNDFNGEL